MVDTRAETLAHLEKMIARQHCLKPASFPGRRDPGNEVGVKLGIDVILSGL